MFCNRCGNKLSSRSLFCNRCGTPVEEPEEESAESFDAYQDEARGGAAAMPPPPRQARRSLVQPRRRAVIPPQDFEEEQAPEYEEEDYYYEEDDDEEEEVIFRIGPTFHFVGAAYAVAILLSILLTSAAAKLGIPISVALAISALTFLLPFRLHIENKRVAYTLTTIKVEIEEGIFSQTTRNIPLRHIQDVSIHQPFSDRLLGIGDVKIDSEAAAGTITMRNIDSPREYADLILDQLQYWK
ncbi:MAG: PH domain-containing protein [Blastocatellia bacterium]